jgi:tetratricopeptide (TPR) repeat protein
MPAERGDRITQRARAGGNVTIAGRDINNNYYPSAQPTLPGLLPRDVPAFTGRDDELARLAALAGGGRVVVSAIGGTAGVGKTALAVHAAHQLLEHFPGGHLYADLRGYTDGQDPADPGQVLQVFLRHLGISADMMPADVDERSGLLRQLLAKQPVLMVLDNARTETQVRPLLPGTGGSLVLVTSRSVLSGLEVDERISLDVLPELEAAAMLIRAIGEARAETEPQAVAELAGLCGQLPLALRIAGQLLAVHPAWPVIKLTEVLAGEQDRLSRLGAGDLQVRAAFRVSYAQLTEEDARVFRLLGLHPGPDFTAGSAAALAGTSADTAELVLTRLAETSLITESATGRFSMHDLLRLYARETCREIDRSVDQEAAESRLVGYYVGLTRFLGHCVNRGLNASSGDTAEQRLLSMREALGRFQAERPGLLSVLDLATQRGWEHQVMQLGESMKDSLTVLLYLDDLLKVGKAAVTAARRAGDRPSESQALENLGDSFKEVRRFEEAIDCYQQGLAICEESGNRYGGAGLLNGLAHAYTGMRRFEEAINCYQQVLAIAEETGDRRTEGMILNNLSALYLELRWFEEAIDWCQQALAVCRESRNRRGELLALENLGIAYVKQGRSSEGIAYLQRALAIYQETRNRQGEGLVLMNLGGAYLGQRRSGEAIDCYQQALVIYEAGGDRHFEGQALDNLGSAYLRARRRGEAVECYQRALAIYRQTGDRFWEGQVLRNLADAYVRMRRFGRAKECLRAAGAAFQDVQDSKTVPSLAE